MSDTHTEIVIPARPLESAPARRRTATHWPKRLLVLLAILWLADTGISILIDHTSLRTDLTAHLEAAFGRPVQVGSYDFALWRGPALEAQSVTVDEDPRFGREYFLRAESLSLRLRWRSLLRGRLEWGTLSLTRPTLNLVRNARGEWNLAAWLPQSADTTSQGLPAVPPAPRFRRIEVDDGRINFKRGDEKLPFAFVGVSGAVETESPGLWSLDLEAAPWRAGVEVQQAGVLRLAGRVGGTSSRLLPAMLTLSWGNASISDVLRLACGNDFGIRGGLGLSVAAHAIAGGWSIQGRAELQQLHRWDLPLRPDNPSLNINADGKLDPQVSSLEFDHLALETPSSSAHAFARIGWNRAGIFAAQEFSPVMLQVFSSKIGLDDILAWLRAFHPGVSGALSVRGWVAASGVVAGWPPHLVNATVSTDHAELWGPPLRVPARLDRVKFRYDRGFAWLFSAALSFGSSANALSAEASAKLAPHASSSGHISGNVADAGDPLATTSSLGWDLARGYELRGPFSCDLQWKGTRFPWQARPSGWIELGGASLRVPFLNLPVEQIQARAEFQREARQVTLSSAEAFGTHWSGSFSRPGSPEEWRFALSASRLSAADLDRWVNPRWREGFLGRILPFLNYPSPAAAAAPENLRAGGRLSIAEFTLPPVSIDRFQGDLEIEGRRIELTNATGQFYGGGATVSLDAHLLPSPLYSASLDFSRVDLSALSTAFPSLAGFFAGEASGRLSFVARGATRADLLASLECRGAARLTGPTLYFMDLKQSLRAATALPGTTVFRQGSARFTCGQGKLLFQDLSLADRGAGVNASGRVDFARHLDFRLRLFSPAASATGAPLPLVGPTRGFYLGGSLAAPQIMLFPPPRRYR
ncbi:MAG: AsmA-like C-terminal region-containing protein [Candidatus Acidiferrales bacterium]